MAKPQQMSLMERNDMSNILAAADCPSIALSLRSAKDWALVLAAWIPLAVKEVTHPAAELGVAVERIYPNGKGNGNASRNRCTIRSTVRCAEVLK
jgi:hypothetical protein